MRRKLFTLAAGVSAVLCAGVLWTWAWTWRIGQEWRWVSVTSPPNPTWRSTMLDAEHGVVGVQRIRLRATYKGNDPLRGRGLSGSMSEESLLDLLVTPGYYRSSHAGVLAGSMGTDEPPRGFLYRHQSDAPFQMGDLEEQVDRWQVSAPIWFTVALTAVGPAAWLRSTRRGKRTEIGSRRASAPPAATISAPRPTAVRNAAPSPRRRGSRHEA